MSYPHAGASPRIKYFYEPCSLAFSFSLFLNIVFRRPCRRVQILISSSLRLFFLRAFEGRRERRELGSWIMDSSLLEVRLRSLINLWSPMLSIKGVSFVLLCVDDMIRVSPSRWRWRCCRRSETRRSLLLRWVSSCLLCFFDRKFLFKWLIYGSS